MGRAPDRIWFTHWNGKATAATKYLSKRGCRLERVHQYRGPHRRRHGGVRMVVDGNYFALGRHKRGGSLRCVSASGSATTTCCAVVTAAVRSMLPGAWCRASRRPQRVQRSLNAAVAELRIDGVYGKPDVRATRAYQRRTRLEPTGVVNRGTWHALQRGRVGRR